MARTTKEPKGHYLAFKATDEMVDALTGIARATSMSVSHVIRVMISDALKRRVVGPKIEKR